MKSPICPEHKISLNYTDTQYGKRYYCPDCDVVLWEGSTSTPANYETRQLRIKRHALFDKRWKTKKNNATKHNLNFLLFWE